MSAPACEASLKRLGVNVIDLYYQHRVDPQHADRGNRRRDGRIGQDRERCDISAFRSLGSKPFAGRESSSHRGFADGVFALDPGRGSRVLPTCRELGIGFVAYSPLGRGFLTGQIQEPDDLPVGDRRRHISPIPRTRISRRIWTWSRKIETIGGEEKLQAIPIGSGLGFGAGTRHCADSRNQEAKLSGRKRRRGPNQPFSRRAGGN